MTVNQFYETLLDEIAVPLSTMTKARTKRDQVGATAADRRKFYVSLTRARHAVHIFYSGWFQWKPGGRINDDGPRRFLRELGLA